MHGVYVALNGQQFVKLEGGAGNADGITGQHGAVTCGNVTFEYVPPIRVDWVTCEQPDFQDPTGQAQMVVQINPRVPKHSSDVVVRVSHRGHTVETPGRVRHLVDRAGDWQERTNLLIRLRARMVRLLCDGDWGAAQAVKAELAAVAAEDNAVRKQSAVITAPALPAIMEDATMLAARAEAQRNGEDTGAEDDTDSHVVDVAVSHHAEDR